MKKVTKIEWTFHTSNLKNSGTDRLDKGEVRKYWWEFKNPSGIGTAVSGQAVPYTEDFPNGIRGHLKVQLAIRGDDAWRVGVIESRVVYGEMVGVKGTIDSWKWEEGSEYFEFKGEDVLSTDKSEGIHNLNLIY